MRSELKEAREVLGKLRDLDATYAATVGAGHDPSQRVDHHRIFLLLYFYTTVRWLQFAEESDCPAFFNRFLVEFYLRYVDYVFTPAINNVSGRCPHWQGYFRWADVYRRQPGHLTRVTLLRFGAYAHTRYDLAEAIAAASRVVGHAERAKAEREIVGARSGRVFSGAALDFVLNCDRLLPEIVLSPRLRSFCLYVHRNDYWWLPRFQQWRRAAWHDAMRMVETGRASLTADRIAVS
jgi:hypothetical protein